MLKKIIFILLKKIPTFLKFTNLQKIKFIKSVYKLVLRYSKPTVINVSGNRMFLDHNDTLRLSIIGGWEFLETALFKSIIKKGDVVVDIGAHIGYYTLLASKLVGPYGKVYAFEPNPERFSVLSKNVKLNKCQNVICVNKGVFNRNQKLKLPILFDQKKLLIETIKLDSFFKDKPLKIDVIKMDIDGSEKNAVLGMKNILTKNPNIKLLTEFWPAGIKVFGSSASSYLKLLNNLGFKYLEVNEKEHSIKVVTEGYLLDKYSSNNLDYKMTFTNLFCFK